jgi:hypothetical protein
MVRLLLAMVGGSGALISTFRGSMRFSRQSGEIVRQIGEVLNEDYIDVGLFVARDRRVCGICCQEDPLPLDSMGSGPCCFSLPGTGLSRAGSDRSALRRVQRHAHHVPGLSWTLTKHDVMRRRAMGWRSSNREEPICWTFYAGSGRSSRWKDLVFLTSSVKMVAPNWLEVNVVNWGTAPATQPLKNKDVLIDPCGLHAPTVVRGGQALAIPRI